MVVNLTTFSENLFDSSTIITLHPFIHTVVPIKNIYIYFYKALETTVVHHYIQ